MNFSATQVADHSLILYDGVCGLCNHFVQFILRHDLREHFLFCALEDPLAVEILARHQLDPATLNTVCVVTHPFSSEEGLLLRSDAALEVLSRLGPGWRMVGGLLRLVPRLLRDLVYRIVARIRYRLFGRLSTCPVPTGAQRHRFLIST